MPSIIFLGEYQLEKKHTLRLLPFFHNWRPQHSFVCESLVVTNGTERFNDYVGSSPVGKSQHTFKLLSIIFIIGDHNIVLSVSHINGKI